MSSGRGEPLFDHDDDFGGEAVEIVKIVDGVNRVRFAGDPDLMAAWKSASNVIGPSRPMAKPEGSGAPLGEGAEKPAA